MHRARRVLEEARRIELVVRRVHSLDVRDELNQAKREDERSVRPLLFNCLARNVLRFPDAAERNLPGIEAEILRRRDSLTRDRKEQDPPADTP